MEANKQNWLPCNLVQADNYSPVPGVAFNAVGLVVTYRYNGQAPISKPLALADWAEGSEGGYAISFSAEECNQVGRLDYWVAYTGCVPYSGSVEVTDGIVDGGTPYTPGAAMQTLVDALALQGLIIDCAYIKLDDFQMVSISDFEARFGAALGGANKYAALVAIDNNTMGYKRFFDAWKALTVIS